MNDIEFGPIHFLISQEPKFIFIEGKDAEMWASKISDLAQKGAKLGECGKMCSDCAFKVNQEHTVDYLEAVDGAVLMLSSDGKFNCHTKEHKNSGLPCVGFEYAKAYFNSIE